MPNHTSNTKENGLEALIVKWLVEQNGYEQGTNADYNREYAVDETRLFRFLQDTQPDAMEKLGVFKTELKKKQFLNRLQGELAKRGVIDVLRNGIKVYPADLVMFYLTPTENNVKARLMHEKNIFSVTRQLQYSMDNTKLALDISLMLKTGQSHNDIDDRELWLIKNAISNYYQSLERLKAIESNANLEANAD